MAARVKGQLPGVGSLDHVGPGVQTQFISLTSPHVIIIFMVLRMEPRVLCMLGKPSRTSRNPIFFVFVF